MKKNNELMNRAKALKKLGKYAALTTAATFSILNPKQAQAFTTGTGGGFGRSGKNDIWKD